MPHLKIDYTSNLQLPELPENLSQLHQLVVEQVPGAKLENCKTRVNRVTEYLLADGDVNHALIAVELAILTGRSLEARQQIAVTIQDYLTAQANRANPDLNIEVCVYVTEINPEVYVK